MKVKRGIGWGVKRGRKKQAKRQKYIKKNKNRTYTYLFQKSSPYDRKTFRYICMVLYVILCMYSFGVFYSFEITPNIIESILEFLLVAIELVLFFILFDTVWPSHESKKDKQRKMSKNLHTLQAHQVDSVITVAMIVAAQVMVEEIAEVVETKLISQKSD